MKSVTAMVTAVLSVLLAATVISPLPSDDASDTPSSTGRAPGAYRPGSSKYRRGPGWFVPSADQHRSPPCAWRRNDAACAEKRHARKPQKQPAPSAKHAGAPDLTIRG